MLGQKISGDRNPAGDSTHSEVRGFYCTLSTQIFFLLCGACERGEGLVETGVGVEDNQWKSALVGLQGRAAQGLKGAPFLFLG